MNTHSQSSSQMLEIGRRFKTFREKLGKTQGQLAAELSICQSAIANVEKGKVFPGVCSLNALLCQYALNVNWLLTGQGHMRIGEKPDCGKYDELFKLMNVPLVEQIIFAKLTETRVVLKEEIRTYFEQKKENQTF